VLLDDGFARLGLLDPERHFRDAIASYPRDAVVDAIAIFAGTRTAGTLPDGVDARYLLGIINHHIAAAVGVPPSRSGRTATLLASPGRGHAAALCPCSWPPPSAHPLPAAAPPPT
jgi:hypothetical protein